MSRGQATGFMLKTVSLSEVNEMGKKNKVSGQNSWLLLGVGDVSFNMFYLVGETLRILHIEMNV